MTTRGTRTRRTAPARGCRDRGAFQSTFIALLVVIALVISICVVALGPKIGGQVADYLICKLLSSEKDGCKAPSTNGINGQSPPPPGPAVVTTVDLPGNCDATANLVSNLFPGGHWTGQDFQNLAAGISVPAQPGIHVDNSIGGSVQVNGCMLVFSTTDDLSKPSKDPRTNIDWASIGRTIAAAAISFITGAIAFAACVAGGTEPICPFIGGYVAGFFYEIALAAMEHGTLSGTDVIKAFIAGIAGGALGGAAGQLTKLGKELPKILTKVREAIESGFSKMWGWIQDIARAGKDIVVDWITAAADYIRANPPWQPSPPVIFLGGP